MAQAPRLLDQVRQVMRLKHMSLRTEESYLYYIKGYILFHDKRHPQTWMPQKFAPTSRTSPSNKTSRHLLRMLT